MVAQAAVVAAAATAVSVGVAVLTARRVVVEGRSMLPALEPGDRLLVLRLPPPLPLRAGAVVVACDPRRPDRVLVKRVARSGDDGVTVVGDNAQESTDSRHFGPLDRRLVVGVAWYRYAPPGRTGRLARPPGPARRHR